MLLARFCIDLRDCIQVNYAAWAPFARLDSDVQEEHVMFASPLGRPCLFLCLFPLLLPMLFTAAPVAADETRLGIGIAPPSDGPSSGTTTDGPTLGGLPTPASAPVEPTAPPANSSGSLSATSAAPRPTSPSLLAPAPTPIVDGQTADDRPPLEPVPDSLVDDADHAVKVGTASFNEIVPGKSSQADLEKSWGMPIQVVRQGETLLHLYSVEPFNHIEVGLRDSMVTSIVIRLESSLPASDLAESLELGDIRAVLVSDELGKILGQTFPERGVMFAFEPADTPGKATMEVAQIIIESVTAESFVLRAETYLNLSPAAAAGDLETAVRLDPTNARAFWLQGRVLATLGDDVKALAACDEAVRVEPGNAEYQLTRAQVLGQMGRFEQAMAQAKAALPNAEKRPHVKARALCLLGDLAGSGATPDHQEAIGYHTRAIEVADPLAVSPHPAIRLAAKEVLIDAHLGAAHDIAWGNWNAKQTAVPKWLERAAAFAEELIQNDGGTSEHRFRVGTRALAAYVGAEGQLDPTEWAEETLRIGQELIDAVHDPERKQRLQWDLGVALYDAIQVYQMRSDHQQALQYSERAIELLEASTSGGGSLEDRYLLGRLYFRLGAIHAVGSGDHKAAVTWFEKANPIFSESVERIAPQEAGRLGETLVSMGVSYWESGSRNRAIELTERGAALIEKAIKSGHAEATALEVPYSNLGTMHRQLGDKTKADRYFEQARRGAGTVER